VTDEEQEKEGFRIQDRRSFTQTGERRPGGEETPPERGRDAEPQTSREPRPRSAPPRREEAPEMDFVTFLLSLGSQTLIHLGEIPDPVSRKREKNLLAAKQTIDLLGILAEKTQGNLTREEGGVLQNLLTDLRMRYVKAAT